MPKPMQKGSRGLALMPSGERRQGVRHALLRTLPGRAIVIGLVARVAVYAVGVVLGTAPMLLGVIDTAASVALAVGAGYFVFRLLVTAKRRLLWRVRRKLILSYIFIGFIPALLIVAFFLLSGFLLFYNVSSYLVQSRLRALADESRFLAQSTAREIQYGGGRDVAGVVGRRQAAAEGDLPGLSIAVVPMSRACAATSTAGTPPSTAGNPVVAGAWSHVDPPNGLPGWIGCPGFAGILAYTSQRGGPAGADDSAGRADTHMLVRAASFPDSPRPGYAVIVDVPVEESIRQRLRAETGVDVNDMRALVEGTSAARPLRGRLSGETARSTTTGASQGVLNNLPSLFAYRDWESGESGTLTVGLQLSISELYDRITSQGFAGLNMGRSLLLVLFIIGGLFLVIEFVALVAGLALAKSITGSVHQLFTGTERVRQGDFTHKIAVKTDDQLGELSESFNSMTASIEDLLRQAAEKKRLEEELRIAREIQMSLLPQGPLEMPGLSVTALCVPAREVGGDYYDFFRLGERQLGVLIADVSGKGTSAALYMAELKGLMLSLSQIHRSPRDLMLAANRIIAANLDARSFITMTYAVIDLDLATMTYARAGHTPLMYVPGPDCDQERHVQVLAPDGLVLGLNIDKGEMFERLLVERTIKLHAGDLALFFTDGISEAMNDAEDFFGEGRLSLLIEEHAHLSSDELRERVLREVQAFVGTAPQHDDMTMIFLKVDAVGVPAAPEAETAELVKY
jgi:sigma-B regulation protein RsbU (phosphoserine phosphatase)